MNIDRDDPYCELDELTRTDGRGVRLPSAYAFDESRYLADNPDVAAVVKDGGFASGYAHWVTHGSVEGRAFADGAWGGHSCEIARKNFDEALYLARNADVAAAVANRTLQSGFDHWYRSGRGEGRPFPARAVVSPLDGSSLAEHCASSVTASSTRPKF